MGDMLTTLVREVDHAADEPCATATQWRTMVWRRAHGQGDDTADRDMATLRMERMRSRAVPIRKGERCSHIELTLAPQELNMPKDTRKAWPDVAERIL